MESTLSSDELLNKNMEFSSQPLSETCPILNTASAGLDCNPTTSTDSYQSTIPRRRTFASVAQRVIIQERLRKAEEEDDTDEEEDEEPEEDLSKDQMEEKAEAGDARAQTRLGQHYLILAEEEDRDLNNRLAVNWLIKAAKQGRKSAARALQRCWIRKIGITAENQEDVRKLSAESKFERAVRKAAMMMYWNLNPEKKSKVAMVEMLENVSQVNKGLGDAAKKISGPTSDETQKILENMVSSETKQLVDLDDFVEMTKNYAQGIVPSSSETGKPDGTEAELPPSEDKKNHGGSWSFGRSGIVLDAKQTGAIKKAMDMKSRLMMLHYPIDAVMDVKEHLVDWASRAGLQWLSTIIPTQHVNTLIFFFIISNLTIDLFSFVIPLLVFYLSFISMIICTLRVFQRSKTWENFRTLTSLLTRFDSGLDIEQAENDFGWNNLEPYLYFIFSVFFVIFSFPVADKGWIPCSELSTVAIFFTAVSYQSLSPVAATYARQAMLIEVASSLCGLTQLLPENMTMLGTLGRTFATLPLGESIVLKLSLPCLLYVYLFYLFFSMARKRGFRGTYCILVPYLVCFMWCEFSVVLLQNSTAVGIIRTCVAYFLLLFALPVLAVGLAIMLLIQLFKWFLELELTKMIVTLVVCAIPVILRLWTRFSTSILGVFRSVTQRGPVKLILLCISLVILFFSIYVYHAEGQKVYNSTLTWDQYSQVCGPPAWQSKGMAKTQIFCSHLQGHRVTWTGRFRHVTVAETENGAQSVINMLPVFLGDWLRCLYGERYPKCESKNVTNQTVSSSAPVQVSLPMLLRMQEEEEMCQIKALAKHTCHVKRFDSYRFQVTVGMIRNKSTEADDQGRDIVLMASHEFRQVLLNLEPGNMVEFCTKLEGRLGAKAPALELKAINCLDCVSPLLPGGRQVKIERDWRRTTMRALNFAFDFFFSPFLSVKITG
ncbi:wolframin isoform X1 [Hippocampus comes]|uniref:wolframin isoform X1 n=1 Tax=Hippocampus comes TaxID=109280 RepID=UPI00094E3D79|nr:PREDICTED: wolframin-like isoform X1 [Hippocampus comes]XP_019718086.1 PREDICTED: wolframin-like isoform X1 [Hippocampus comes]XP_019718087.1 PREDICTED: wolframin-like isoform X1 [Hippocampus comes]XP_019718088.1 PREDICTED: wolframin-like isoform X1 [Hippocampus comes]XP_019718089.1 PREDICTED: wolframin-like isoform X1 [Hippocampus comes]XP_019718090.1 PREDICTED: wolframin-like isoform X1 [Hippocampus comes]